MELSWLEDFISLANTGSFSTAAGHRNISQSAFSRRIHSLEHWLGSILVDRHNHPVTLTDAGSQFLAVANQVIRTMYKTREDFGYRENATQRTLALGVADHLAVHFAPEWLQQIEPILGERKIQLVTGLKAGISFVELLKSLELDFLLAYGGSVSAGDHESSMFESLVLGNDVLVPVCKKDLLADPTFHFPSSPDKPIPYLSYMPASAMANLINRESTRRVSPIHLNPVIETGNVETIKALALRGFGMAWLPYIAIQRELELGALAELTDESHRIPFSIELFRCSTNTKPEVIVLWDKIKNSF
jgi:DNA-binding transcriptional LysR family regulator